MSFLFTFILEHDGATSVSQVVADDLTAGFDKWRTDLASHLVEILDQDDILELQLSLQEDDPVALMNRTNVWFVCGQSKSGFGRVHIVQTATLATRARQPDLPGS